MQEPHASESAPMAQAARQAPREAAPPAEPATARALWPTFMRRTLSEEALRRPSDRESN